MDEQEYSYGLKVPRNRIAVLIGKSGEVKKQLEAETYTKIDIDSREGDVTVTGTDAINLLCTREIIKAIARGFNPEIAKLLMKQDYVFEQLDINDYVKHRSHSIRLKGRVIGEDGKSRRTIEDLSETYISVLGKTICIIGLGENVAMAKRAIEALLGGSPHASVYRALERKRAQMRRAEIAGFRKPSF